MAKEILYDDQARLKLQTGVNKLADAVKQTLGPKGKYVIIDQEYGSPIVTNDGVSIARNIDLKDRFENMGAKLIKEVSSKTEELSGDGTTTATILTQSILNQGLKYVNNGVNPRFIKSGIEKTTEALVEQLHEIAKPVKTNDDIKNIAAVSAKDDNVGTLIGEAMEKVTKNGVISVEEGKSFETTIDVVTGYYIDSGFASPYFGSETKDAKTIFENAYVLIADKKITHINDILKILEQVMKTGKELVIIAEDFSEEFISAIIVNKMRGLLNVSLIKASGFGDSRTNQLKDIAFLTNTKVVEKLDEIKEMVLEDLGIAAKMEVSKNQTIIINDMPEGVDEYIATIDQDNSSDKKRIAKLLGGVGVIKVGASTQSEAKEKQSRIEDALQATKAAMDEGVVPGGGIALLQALAQVNLDFVNDDERIGSQIIAKAIEQPFRQIVINADENPDVALLQVKNSKFAVGFDAYDNSFKDLSNHGIIDPLKNVRVALENAASIASLILQTGVAITPEQPNN